jgi:hypothetical protein
MFEMFVVGPVATRRLGLIGRCIDCQNARGKHAPCSGFGEGCLAAPRPTSPPAPPRAYDGLRTTSFW